MVYKNMKSKKGVSPIIATILLIALVIIIGTIVFMWFRSMTQEAITKFDKNIELVCDDVQFDSSYSTGGVLTISNLGNIPIYSMNVKMEGGGSYETNEITDTLFGTNWPEKGLNQGAVVFGEITAENYEKITLIPILMGINPDGETKTHTCEERHGQEIPLE